MSSKEKILSSYEESNLRPSDYAIQRPSAEHRDYMVSKVITKFIHNKCPVYCWSTELVGLRFWFLMKTQNFWCSTLMARPKTSLFSLSNLPSLLFYLIYHYSVHTWWARQIRSRSCLARNLDTISGPKVKETPLSFSPHPWTSLSGSDHSRSHNNPKKWENLTHYLMLLQIG